LGNQKSIRLRSLVSANKNVKIKIIKAEWENARPFGLPSLGIVIYL